MDARFFISNRVLHDDGFYSVIWGKYRGVPALGVRWNHGEDEDEGRGYPGQGIHPTWYIEPDFIGIAIVHRILTKAQDENKTEYLNNIYFALQELNYKIQQENAK